MDDENKSIKDILTKWLRENITVIFLISIVGIGFSVTAYLTIKNEYVPSTKEVINAMDNDIFVVVKKDREILAPITTTFLERAKSNVIVEIYFITENVNASSFKAVVLSTNSSSILTVPSTDFRKGNASFANYTAAVEIGHPLEVNNFTEAYYIDIFYRFKNQTVGELTHLRIPIEWNVRTLDFGRPSYFWIIFAGVLLSRIFSYSPNISVFSWKKLDTRDVLWAPFSAIITLLIFSSFREQVVLTNDIITNLALAFGFGFAFDKVLEVWQKSPSKNISTTTAS